MQRLIQNSHFYTEEAPKLETPPPPFQLGLQTLPDASHTANRMRAVVRRAQKDFHFATIYEQRKTNQLLVAGFSSLGQAINELGDRLDSRHLTGFHPPSASGFQKSRHRMSVWLPRSLPLSQPSMSGRESRLNVTRRHTETTKRKSEKCWTTFKGVGNRSREAAVHAH